MNILGISCFYHDAAACLFRDGRVIAAASEERFNRTKNSPLFPIEAINFCLQAGGLTGSELDYVGFYEKPFLKFYRVIASHLRSYPFSFRNFRTTIPYWLQERLSLPLFLKSELDFEKDTLFIKHHLSHAASAFLVSPFKKAVILTADGVGEWACMSRGTGQGNQIKIDREMRFPDSLGLLYTAITTYLGFEALEGEGKVMGLAGYGKPAYLDALKKMVTVHPDGSLMIDRRFFGFNEGSRMYSRKFVKTLGKERLAGQELEQRHFDIAASLQKLTEDILITIARKAHEDFGCDALCLAGGLFLNCVANARIMEETPFKDVFIQPAAGDSGGALGVAAYIHHSFLGNRRTYVMTDAYLGPGYSSSRIKRTLANRSMAYKEFSEEGLVEHVARSLAQDKVVGWFQGRMEFGPRALGNRSILATPCNPRMKEIINSKVKHRESFRPYAPAVLEERVFDFFEAKQFSPFMLLAAAVKKDKQRVIPAATHVDGTARVQTVSKAANPRFWSLIKKFEEITGVPVVINTSFNMKGEPIVCTPEDALEDFSNSQMDMLVMENIVIERQ